MKMIEIVTLTPEEGVPLLTSFFIACAIIRDSAEEGVASDAKRKPSEAVARRMVTELSNGSIDASDAVYMATDGAVSDSFQSLADLPHLRKKGLASS